MRPVSEKLWKVLVADSVLMIESTSLNTGDVVPYQRVPNASSLVVHEISATVGTVLEARSPVIDRKSVV